MKNSHFGQGKRVPQQFNDYLNVLAGAETIFYDLANKIETTMQEYYRLQTQSEVEYNISELVVKQFIKQLRMKFQVVLDKFDIYMKEKFEDHYINYRRMVHKKQMRQLQKKVINLESYELITKQFSVMDEKLNKEFDGYFEAFIERLDIDTANYLDCRDRSTSDITINDKFDQIIQENEAYIQNQII